MLNPFEVLNPAASSEGSRPSGRAALWIVGPLFVILALNAAGQLHLGLLGLASLIFIFMLLGWAGCYWYMASIHFLTAVMGIEQRRSQPWLAILQGLWPLIFLGPAMSAQRAWPTVGLLITLVILGFTAATLLIALRRAYRISWPQSVLCIGLTGLLSGLALLGVVGWPSMVFLGMKYLSVTFINVFMFA
jgi:hypothetical protein